MHENVVSLNTNLIIFHFCKIKLLILYLCLTTYLIFNVLQNTMSKLMCTHMAYINNTLHNFFFSSKIPLFCQSLTDQFIWYNFWKLAQKYIHYSNIHNILRFLISPLIPRTSSIRQSVTYVSLLGSPWSKYEVYSQRWSPYLN